MSCAQRCAERQAREGRRHGDSGVKAGREPRGSTSDSQLPTSSPGIQPSLKYHAIPQLPGLVHAKLQCLTGLRIKAGFPRALKPLHCPPPLPPPSQHPLSSLLIYQHFKALLASKSLQGLIPLLSTLFPLFHGWPFNLRSERKSVFPKGASIDLSEDPHLPNSAFSVSLSLHQPQISVINLLLP